MGSAAVSGRFDFEMSDEISDLIDGISMAIDNREFTEADELATELEEVYLRRQDEERSGVEDSKRHYEAADQELEEVTALDNLVRTASSVQLSRVAALTLVSGVTETHESLAEEGILEQYITTTQGVLADLQETESEFSSRTQIAESIGNGEKTTIGNGRQNNILFGFTMEEIVAGGAVTTSLAYITIKLLNEDTGE